MESEPITKAHCNRCAAVTSHTVLSHRVVAGWSDETKVEEPIHPGVADWWEEYDLLQCCGCGTVCLRLERHLNEEDVPEGFEQPEDIHFYPPRLFRRVPRWHAELPFELRSVFEEVYWALAANSLRLAAMGARTAIDLVIADKVGDLGPFRQKLESLESQGYISRLNREHLASALDVGSAAAHRGHLPTAEDMSQVMDIVENVVHAVYVLGSAAKDLKDKTPGRFPRK